MTLAVAWIRRIADCEELVVSADSRLGGDGRRIDGCAKIIALPRSDCFLCCAGDTGITYPLAHRVASAIQNYTRSADRALDIKALRAHILKLLTSSLQDIHSDIDGWDEPDRYTQLLFGGYSWVEKRFLIWRLSYNKMMKTFRHQPTPNWCGGKAHVLFAGDWQHEGKRRLISLMRSRYGVTPQTDAEFYFDWEPFEVLRDCLREVAGNFDQTIGGAPQILKVYQHLNSRQIGVFWPDRRADAIYVQGRRMLDYERPECWVLDPDTLTTSNLIYSRREANQQG